MRRRNPMGWPPYMIGKKLSLGRTGYYCGRLHGRATRAAFSEERLSVQTMPRQSAAAMKFSICSFRHGVRVTSFPYRLISASRVAFA